MQNCILHLLLQHDFIVEESRCWTCLPQSKPNTNWKLMYLTHHLTQMKEKPRTIKKLESFIRQEWEAAQQLVSSDPKWLLLKEEEIHSGNMALSKVLLPSNSKYFSWNGKMSNLQHLKCFLCSAVDKILFFWDLKITAFCFYLHFTQYPNFCCSTTHQHNEHIQYILPSSNQFLKNHKLFKNILMH